MTCRSCGARIAPKALICYKCGAATTEAKYQPADIGPRRSSNRLVLVAAVVLVTMLAAVYFLLLAR